MRVADIDITQHKENCPTGFREVTSSGKRMCGGRGEGCVSTSFSSHGVECVGESLATSLDGQMVF